MRRHAPPHSKPPADCADTMEAILHRIGRSPDKVIPVLQAIQVVYRYLPPEALQYVCDHTDITAEQISGVSTFYSQFRHTPAGEHSIHVCMGTACHVKGAPSIFDAFKRFLKLSNGEDTSEDGKFTLEEVACLGCCTLAPAIQIDGVTYGKVVQQEIPNVIEDFLSGSQEKMPGSTFVKAQSIQGEIRLGLGSCCVASGSKKVEEAVRRSMQKYHIPASLKEVGCVGMCHQVPLLELEKEGQEPVLYAKVEPDQVDKILSRHFPPLSWFDRIRQNIALSMDDWFGGELMATEELILDTAMQPVADFLGKQQHIATAYKGILNPDDLHEYRQKGGFGALHKVLHELGQEAAIEEIKKTGLRGRGGAGFPAWQKWDIVRRENTATKYVICNGDEGDPGAFMDRMLLESFPYRILEGMLIAAFCAGASQAFLYIRAEYPLAVYRIRQAIELCRKQGLLGDSILDSDFSIDIAIFEGAGAFVCGEESALIASMEGERGMPRIRPPYPVQKGLFGKPTLVNNVETFANVPWIISQGAEAFQQYGTAGSPGTKVFSLAGKINRGGLIEVPMGISIREIVEDIGGGIQHGKKFKAVQIGGPSGGCIPEKLADTPVDFQFLKKMGSMMGSGGLVVLDEQDCMVDMAHYFLSFTQEQSCGKCVFCRAGTKHMLEILDRLCMGEGKQDDLHTLESLAHEVQKGSLCGLGKTAPNPIITSLRYYRNEYEAHIAGHCPAKKCKALISYHIGTACIGCTKCAQACPVEAIAFRPHEQHEIDNDKCTRCDACRQICPVDAVSIES